MMLAVFGAETFVVAIAFYRLRHYAHAWRLH